jgi:hypothetical protein
MKASTIVIAGVSVVRLMGSLFIVWLTLDWHVRTARKAFEKQLIRQGMSDEDAKRISAGFKKLKNEMMRTLKTSAFRIR